nr:VWA domain-containing protein [Halobiforma lacisalsi]
MIGLILLLGLVAMAAVLILLTGFTAVDTVESDISQERGEQVMSQFDADLHTALIDGDASESVYLAEEGTYELSNSTLSVSVSNGYSEPETIDDIEIGTLEYDDGEGNRIGHQAGGVWRIEGDTSTVVSEPDIRYYREENEDGDEVGRLDLSVTSLQGEVGNGEHTVEPLERGEPSSVDDAIDEVGFVDDITLTISDTPYHDAWAEFLKDEFDAVEVDDCDAAPSDTNAVCHDPDNQEVSVVATIDADNPFADHVGLEPTVYGGLYAEESEGNYNELNVRGYDDHEVGTNSSDDLLVINDDLTLTGSSTVEAVPVLDGILDKTGGKPTVSQITYAGGIDGSGPPADYEFINTTGDGNTEVYWLDGDTSDNLVANMSSPFDPVEPIDDELETAVEDLEYLESTDQAGDAVAEDDLEAGLYYGSSLDPSSIDTRDGDVHVGTDGSVTLSDLEIEGGNSTYLYADGPVTIKDEVTIEDDDRAHALWVYGNSNDKITIEADFEGVVYAPGSEVEIKNNVEITGAVVAGDVKLGPHATINFDRSLRTDVPIPEENREIEVVEVGTRDPLDVTFVLDRSGSMGPGNPFSSYYSPSTLEKIDGDEWQPMPVDDPFRNYWRYSGSNNRIEVKDENGNTSVLDPRQGGRTEQWEEIRVYPDDCGYFSCDTYIGTYPNAGNDPDKLRVDATRDFIGMLNQTEDRAGIYEFATVSDTQALQELTDDLTKVEESVVGNEYGGTNIAAGMDRALDDYRTTPANGNERVMILLSDGENSDSNDDEVARELAEEDANDLDVTIYTIGLGFDDLNEDLLEDIAEETGGENVNVDDAEELEDVFGEIGEDVTAESDFTFDIDSVPDSASGSSEYVIDIDEHSVLIED